MTPYAFNRIMNAMTVLYTSKALGRIWNRANSKARKKYDVPLINLYNMRHSFACQRLNSGLFTIHQISDVLGHSSVKMTEQQYAKYMTEKLGPGMRGVQGKRKAILAFTSP